MLVCGHNIKYNYLPLVNFLSAPLILLLRQHSGCGGLLVAVSQQKGLNILRYYRMQRTATQAGGRLPKPKTSCTIYHQYFVRQPQTEEQVVMRSLVRLVRSQTGPLCVYVNSRHSYVTDMP